MEKRLSIFRSVRVKSKEVVFEGNSTRYHFILTKISGNYHITDVNNNKHFQLARHLLNEFDINYILTRNDYSEGDREIITPHLEYFLLDY